MIIHGIMIFFFRMIMNHGWKTMACKPGLNAVILRESVFSRHFSREKCPTLTVASFFVRLQFHSDWATFLTIETTKTTTIRSSPVSRN